MSLITLTTDFGTKDHFVASIKGTIYNELPDAKVVDISHQISPFNITETAYILKNAYKSFPNGSIHIIGVDAELNQENKHIAVKIDGHFFICADNGLISLILSEINPEKMVEINIHDRVEQSNSPLNIFIHVACHIARGGTLDVIGKQIKDYKILTEIQPVINKEQNQILGAVLYIDNYGNVISNISKKLFQEIGKGRSFEIMAHRYKFTKIHKNYSDIVDFSLPEEQRQKDGSKLALFNSSEYLEIALYKSNLTTLGGASTMLGLNYRDNIVVKFNDL